MSIKMKRWVLIADEDELSRKSTEEALVSHFGKNVKIVNAANGISTLSKLSNQTFHLVILSWTIPRKPCDEVIEAIRTNQFNGTTPIIVTAKEDVPNIEKNFEFINFFKTPYDKESFVTAVQNLFNLGSTEKMIEASIFSSLLDSSFAFLKEALGREDFKLSQMQKKKRGEKLSADYAAIITVYIGKVKNTFSVLCDKPTLESIRDGSEKIEGSSLEVISRALGYVILKHVLTECGIINHNEVRTQDITNVPLNFHGHDPITLLSKAEVAFP